MGKFFVIFFVQVYLSVLHLSYFGMESTTNIQCGCRWIALKYFWKWSLNLSMVDTWESGEKERFLTSGFAAFWVNTRAHTHTHTHTHTYPHTHKHTHTHTNTHKIHIHTNMHTHTTCISSLATNLSTLFRSLRHILFCRLIKVRLGFLGTHFLGRHDLLLESYQVLSKLLDVHCGLPLYQRMHDYWTLWKIRRAPDL